MNKKIKNLRRSEKTLLEMSSKVEFHRTISNNSHQVTSL